MKQTATFRLKCVVCGKVETRPAEQCKEQPYCNCCGGPMILEEAAVKTS